MFHTSLCAGALLSHFIPDPLYFASITLPVPAHSSHSPPSSQLAALERAVMGRLGPLAGQLSPPYRLNQVSLASALPATTVSDAMI